MHFMGDRPVSPVPSPRLSSFFDAASTLHLALLPPAASVCFYFAYPQPSDARPRGRIGAAKLPFAPFLFPRGRRKFSRWRSPGGVDYGVCGSEIPPYPMFGFGAGGLFGFLILMTIAGALVNALRGGGPRGGGGALPSANGRKLCHQARWARWRWASCRFGCGQCPRVAAGSAPAAERPTPPTAPPAEVLQETCLALMASAPSSGSCQLRSGPGAFVSGSPTFTASRYRSAKQSCRSE